MRYAQERQSFGRPIGANQGVSFKIARMQARAHAARLAYYEAAQKMLAGKPFKTEAALAKLISGEAAMDNARDATQVFGGYGFVNESLVARHYRDSKILEIGEGTTEVQLLLIGRLSPVKGSDIALGALERLVADGVDAELTLVGDVFPGYEWFREQLDSSARAAGVVGRVHFAGYQPDVEPYLAAFAGLGDLPVRPLPE